MLFLGVDPGKEGALALYDTNEKRITGMYDFPIYELKGRKKHDAVQLWNLGEALSLIGLECVYVEDVGSKGFYNGKKMSGNGELSYCAGLLKMMFVALKTRIEYVNPQQWKRVMRCPAEKTASVQRADQLFPTQRHIFRGPRGGALDGRAEAAMLALYGATRIEPDERVK